MKLNGRVLDLSQPQVMAIINVTDDSFYSASRTVDGASIALRVREAVGQGAAILDIGGYSSRPGAAQLSLEEEWQRVQLGLQVARREADTVHLSVDTFRAEIARRAVQEFGELIINDISAGEADENMLSLVAHYNLPYVAMHMRGTPQTMQSMTDYPAGVVAEVMQYFEQRVAQLREQGVEKLILDPGFGFAKSVEQNYELLGGVSQLASMGCPVLVGLSRKSMIYRPLDITPEQALSPTTALQWEALRQGATILRVHDTREAVQVVKLFEIYRRATEKNNI